jgi:hypothetical protein
MVDSPGHDAVFVRLYLDRHIVKRLAVDLRGRGVRRLDDGRSGQRHSFRRRAARLCHGGGPGNSHLQHPGFCAASRAVAGCQSSPWRNYRLATARQSPLWSAVPANATAARSFHSGRNGQQHCPSGTIQVETVSCRGHAVIFRKQQSSISHWIGQVEHVETRSIS